MLLLSPGSFYLSIYYWDVYIYIYEGSMNIYIYEGSLYIHPHYLVVVEKLVQRMRCERFSLPIIVS